MLGNQNYKLKYQLVVLVGFPNLFANTSKDNTVHEKNVLS